VLVYITDGDNWDMGDMQNRIDPDYPVLWLIQGRCGNIHRVEKYCGEAVKV
jgi:hypothetical protein